MAVPRYPGIMVPIKGEGGNAFTIIGRVDQALDAAGVSDDERAVFRRAALSDNYDHVLQIVGEWVNWT